MLFAALNVDVLFHVLQYLDSQSLCHLTLTCRGGRAVAMPFLLRDVTLRRNWSQILAFCQLVCADISHRAPLICILRLSSQQTVPFNRQTKSWEHCRELAAAMPYLRKVLQAACNLHTVSVSATMGILMSQEHHGILNALLKAPSLAHVVIDQHDDIFHICHGPDYCSTERWMGRQGWFRTLAQLHGLRTIELSAVPGASLRTVLEPHQSTLERLSIQGDVNPAAFPSGLEWPAVHMLTLHSFAPRDVLVRAFPNVRYLQLYGGSSGRVTYDPQLWRANAKSSACWSHLDHVRGTVPGIVSFGVQRRVRRLDIDLVERRQNVSLLAVKESEFLRLLELVSPSVFSLRVPFLHGPRFCIVVLRTIPTLRCFNLQLYHDEAGPRNGMLRYLGLVLDALKGARSLIYLSIHFHGRLYDSAISPRELVHTMEEVARRWACSSRSVRYLELAWEGTVSKCSWWGRTGPQTRAKGQMFIPLSASFGLAARERFLRMPI
ncbi:hypothetical protein AcV5_008836 [Taiwanofungus camphoratus]|nr:hypothetical protein AcV5_008836 [Antrodia cinnamomea]